MVGRIPPLYLSLLFTCFNNFLFICSFIFLLLLTDALFRQLFYSLSFGCISGGVFVSNIFFLLLFWFCNKFIFVVAISWSLTLLRFVLNLVRSVFLLLFIRTLLLFHLRAFTYGESLHTHILHLVLPYPVHYFEFFTLTIGRQVG